MSNKTQIKVVRDQIALLKREIQTLLKAKLVYTWRRSVHKSFSTSVTNYSNIKFLKKNTLDLLDN